MKPIVASLAFCLGVAGAFQAFPATCAEQHYEGQLGSDGSKLPEGQYYDELVFDAQAGQSIKFLIKMAEWMPYAMLYSDDGKLVEHTTGSYGGGGYGLGTQWSIPSSGRWHLIVTISGIEKVPYTLTWDVID